MIWQKSRPASYGVPGGQRQIDVQAFGAGRLRHAGGAELVELVVNPAGDLERPAERHAGHRIEIERGVVGELGRLHAREPGILRDRRELRRVQQRQQDRRR